MSKQVIAIILGGGAGTRLYPLTASRSKPAVPIAGKYRLVDIPISNCINSNITRMYVLTQFNSASLNKHIKNTYHFSIFSSAFVDILAAEQTPDNAGWFQGTADAVRQSFRHLTQQEYDYVLVLSGDQLYQMDFQHMIQSHIDAEADVSIATIPVTAKDATDFGIMKVAADKSITAFIEKPSTDLLEGWASDTGEEMQQAGRNYLASMGIYVFSKGVLHKLLNETYRESTDFGKEILPKSIENHKVVSYQYEGYWTDIGNISSFFEANLALTDDLPPFNLFDRNNAIYSRARMLPPAKINGTTLNRTIIAEGCIIRAASIENSVIGIRSRIGEGTVVQHCYMMGSDYFETIDEMNRARERGMPPIGIGNNCLIQNAIIDKNCRIGHNVQIKGDQSLENSDHELYTVKDGIVVIKKNAIIPDNYIIG
ncbi:glucose-1-phosphate adenylyltransferase [Gynurincola endophyticus]|jgi:glucose-1-phosphate adenylyltransferase|uniref:glucose-1-phosphate adenylyltransferase n=1 Tax=Gynurincola endophyticus TaxID=2479004 RepID=UPI000F8F648B|nr:glucose-1-phosphate adenylyltransferase [Gynurincola endophyticus]